MFGYNKHKEINNWRKFNPGVAVIFDENWNVIRQEKHRTFGTGYYQGIIFKCSKCEKIYPTYGSLKYYHKKCKIKKNKR